MTREIKFRAWVKPLKRYCPIQSIEFDWEGNIDEVWVYVEENVQQPFYAKEVIIEQNTGLKDKNGKEIYGGDIVKAKGEAVINQCIFLDAIAEVVWVPSAAGFGEKFVGKDKPMVPFGSFEYEIIGNIHEKPELLEERER